jgi:hypothetical protein
MGLILGQLKVSEFRNWFWFENCGLQDCYAACSGNSLPTLRDNLSVPLSKGQRSRILLAVTTVRCVTSQKTAVFIYFEADVWNLARRCFLYHVTGWRQGHIPSIPLADLNSVLCLVLLFGPTKENSVPQFGHSTEAGHQTDRVIVMKCILLQTKHISWLRFFYPNLGFSTLTGFSNLTEVFYPDWGFSNLTEVFIPWLKFF